MIGLRSHPSACVDAYLWFVSAYVLCAWRVYILRYCSYFYMQCVCVRECLAHISAGPSHAACLAESFFLLEALLELLQAAPQLVDRLNLAL